MNQSSVIGAALAVAFIIFVINRGDLPCYLQILGIATGAQCANVPAQSQCAASSTASSASSGTSILKTGAKVGVLGTIGGIIGGPLGGVLGGAIGTRGGPF